jgi:hypothetical protein
MKLISVQSPMQKFEKYRSSEFQSVPGLVDAISISYPYRGIV